MPNYQIVDIDLIGEWHPVRAFKTYWDRQAAGGEVPRRHQINPAEIIGILPWLLVLEVRRFGSATEYHYRPEGTVCTELFGIDYTGKSLGDNLTPEGAEIRRREFRQLLDEGKPIFSTTNLPIKNRDFIRVHRGVFPVRAGEHGTDQIFVVIAPVTTEYLDRYRAAIYPPTPANNSAR